MIKREPKILLVGPRLNESGTNVGGATTSFEQLIGWFSKRNNHVEILDSQKNLWLLTVLLFRKILRSEIVFLNSSRNGLVTLGPLVFVLCKLLSKKMVVRPFGDSLRIVYQKSKFYQNIFEKSIFCADLMLLQTQEQLKFFEGEIKNHKWLPTSRSDANPTKIEEKGEFAKRFLYIGQISGEKGILELIEAKKKLDDSYVIDLFGPVINPELEYIKNETYYKGVLSIESICNQMSNYDVLIMPTYYEGEGYPGVIIESYMMGLPVIATNWKSIPEIVENSKTGFLISPRSSDDIVSAIKKFNTVDHLKMRRQARKYYLDHFEMDTVMEKINHEIGKLLE